MSFIPPWEKITETKKCKISGKEFFVTNKEMDFYDQVSPQFGGKKYNLPTPQLCPEERQRRRFSFRNERKLYHRKCDKTGNQIISIYSPDKPYTVYDQKVWWSDDWSAYDFGRKFDFDRPFFAQFDDFLKTVPLLSIYNIDSTNSDYTNFAGYNKNCYLTFGCFQSENCFYGKWIARCRDCIDTFFINDTEKCYGVINCQRCYDVKYSKNCSDCRESWFLRNCNNCDHCFGCDNLVGKSYHVFNQPVSKAEYERKIAAIRKEYSAVDIYEKLLSRSIIEKNFTNSNCENCIGDCLNNCSDCFMIYDSTNSVDCRYNDGIKYGKKSFDTIGNNIDSEYLLECLGVWKSSNTAFSIWWEHTAFTLYTLYSQNVNNVFWCIGLKRWEYSIMNTSYSKQEYEKLCGLIIDHMKATGEWGEFFPTQISPFGYNETVAPEYFPMTREDALSRSWKWSEEEERSSYHGTYYSPLPIGDYDEKIVGFERAEKNIQEILAGILSCEATGKPYKIVRQELAFYIENQIPIPRKHPDERHMARVKSRNPRILHDRDCAECGMHMVTTFAPERPERVVCENCYKKLIY